MTYIAPLFEIGEGCDEVVHSSEMYEVKESKIRLPNLEPFSNYSVGVSSLNDYGTSNMSHKFLIISQSSAPTSPRNISIDFLQHDTDDKKIIGVLRWEAPCKLNGLFSLYMIKLKGSRVGFSSDISSDATTYPRFTYNNFKRGYSYEVTVQAINSKSFGVIGKIEFFTPSGSKKEVLKKSGFQTFSLFAVPSVEDLKLWTNFSNENIREGEKIDIFMKRRIFISEVGDITGIAFLAYRAVS